MFNPSASLAMSTCVLKALPGKLDIKRHSPGILYIEGFTSCHKLLKIQLIILFCSYSRGICAKYEVSYVVHFSRLCAFKFKTVSNDKSSIF